MSSKDPRGKLDAIIATQGVQGKKNHLKMRKNLHGFGNNRMACGNEIRVFSLLTHMCHAAGKASKRDYPLACYHLTKHNKQLAAIQASSLSIHRCCNRKEKST